MNKPVALVAALLLTVSPMSPIAADTLLGQNSSLPFLLQGLGYACNRNIVADQSVPQMPVNIALPMNHCSEALALLARVYHLKYTAFGNSWIASSSGDSTIAVRTHLKYASAATIAKTLLASPLIGQGIIVVGDERTNSILVDGPPQMTSQAVAVLNALDVPGSADEHAFIGVNHADINEATAQLLQLYNNNYGPLNAVAQASTGRILLSGPPGAIAEARSLLAQIDVPVYQVNIAVRIYDVTPRNDTENIGILLGGVAPNGGDSAGNITVSPNQIFTPFKNKSLAINATINTLLEHGEATILGSPNLSVRSGKTQTVLIGGVQPIISNNGGLVGGQTVTSLDTGITLTSTPIASPNGSVHMTLQFGYSQIDGYKAGDFPILASRSTGTTLDLANDETLTFGGYTEDIHTKDVTKIPLLGDIPFFGKLFRNTSSSTSHEEIVFQITPHVTMEAK